MALKRIGVTLRFFDPHDVANLAGDASLQELRKESDRTGQLPRNRIKVQILGDAEVGKTSLRKKLVGEKFDPNEGKTVGIDMHMCECTDVDYKWRRLGSQKDDYSEAVTWYMAKTLTERNREQERTHPNSWKTYSYFWFWLKTLAPALAILVFLQFICHENNFVFSMIACSLMFQLFIDKTTAYKLGGSFCVFLVAADKLSFYCKHKYSSSDDAHHTLLPEAVAFSELCVITVVGFLVGIVVNTGLQNGVVIAFSGMLSPHGTRTCSTLVDTFQTPRVVCGAFVALFGILSSVVLQTGLTKCLQKQLQEITVVAKLKLVAFFLFLVVLLSSVVYSCVSFNANYYVYTAFALLTLGSLMGLEFGRPINSTLKISRPQMWPVTLLFGVVWATAFGWQSPFLFSFHFPSILSVASACTIFCIEMYRTYLYKTSQKASLTDISNNSFTIREFKKTSLPVKLSIWDFAGDEFYYNTHHVFMASRAIFLVVFKLVDFKSKSQRDASLKRLMFWLHSICTHAQARSVIFLVGTHRDQVSPDTRKEIAKYLKDKLYKTSSIYCNRLVINSDNTPLWLVENSQSDDEDIQRLRQAVHLRATKVDEKNESYPIKWLRFQTALREWNYLAEEKTPIGETLLSIISYIHRHLSGKKSATHCPPLTSIMPFKDVFDFASKHCGIQNTKEMVAMLQFFHETGDVIYLAKNQSLNKIVILCPQILIDAVKLIVTLPEEKDREPTEATMWNRLSDEGIIHKQLLTNILDELDTDTRILIRLLQCYGLMCPLGKVGSLPSDTQICEYIIPSMRPVYYKNPRELGPHFGPMVSFMEFYFDFSFFKPDSVFTRLLSKCIQISQHNEVYRNVGRFTIDNRFEKFSFRLDLMEYLPEQHFIKVTTALVPGSNPYILISRLHSYIEAIRYREFPDLKYNGGTLCLNPPPHNGCSNNDLLHILTVCSEEERFPTIGATIERLCGDIKQEIILREPVRNKLKRQVEEEPCEEDVNILPGDVLIPNEDEDPEMFDIYIMCGKRDDEWVKSEIAPLFEDSHFPIEVKVNSYDQRENNASYLRCCPVTIIIINRHSIKDRRCTEERELAYQYHYDNVNSIIHVINDKHLTVSKAKESLGKYVCFDYLDYKGRDEKRLFSEELKELVIKLLEH
ncbi:uncharacterized protein [Ptychodera flava]|uniref:uncharacterized protein n=1 Tax=Ptychodera flava TaxID=63121 RepID=UPI00396A3581